VPCSNSVTATQSRCVQALGICISMRKSCSAILSSYLDEPTRLKAPGASGNMRASRWHRNGQIARTEPRRTRVTRPAPAGSTKSLAATLQRTVNGNDITRCAAPQVFLLVATRPTPAERGRMLHGHQDYHTVTRRTRRQPVPDVDAGAVQPDGLIHCTPHAALPVQRHL
jgi:hypothetical protein